MRILIYGAGNILGFPELLPYLTTVLFDTSSPRRITAYCSG